MERGLPINVLAVNVDFVVVEESDHVVNVSVRDRVEQNVAAHFFHPANHFK